MNFFETIDLNSIIYHLLTLKSMLKGGVEGFILLIPLVMALELPMSVLTISGVVRWYIKRKRLANLTIAPKVSCIVTCYGEGDDILKTIVSLAEQTYPGHVEIIPVVDGAIQNTRTYQAALKGQLIVKGYKNRSIRVVPKWQRGGRVSTLNAGLHFATGELVMNADGDTSFDSDMLVEIVKVFEDPNVPAAGGSLRVRNQADGLCTRMQALEYMISIQGNKTGLAHWNLINNISGAFGMFRKQFLKQVGGWDTHTAEDLDLTVRIKQYFGRHPKLKLPFVPLAIGHTDAPSTFMQLFNQRLRWDGDLVFLYLRKHKYAFNPRLVGWKSFAYTTVYGVWQNVVLPVLLVAANAYYFMTLDVNHYIALFVLQYCFYLVYAYVHFLVFYIFVSERKNQDIRCAAWLVFYPAYGFVMKLVNVFSTFNEITRRAHEESNMAPWWVLKRGKRF